MAQRIDIKGNTAEAGSTQINNVNVSASNTADDIDRSCLRALRCPDSLVIKNRLKENKDKLLHKSIKWIFDDEQYDSWQNRDDVSLLWIKGGAGKGKTMLSIGLIEEMSRRPKHGTVVTYFFCQDADYELNTIDAIIKGLILQLVNQQQELKQSLRDRWDTVNERFNEDVTSWRGLWDIFMEMLDRCKCPKVYVVVDALDECRGDGIANLLKLIVRTGLDHPSRIKWLLTSRHLTSAEQELLTGSDQVMVSLEMNAKHISQGVATYISYKVAELDRRNGYGPIMRQDIENELVQKAEDTFLWVSLVCKTLEYVGRDRAMMKIQDLPPGLIPYYHRILTQLCDGDSPVVMGCIRLLKVMMLTYRPLNVNEVSSVTGLPENELDIEVLVDRCTSFIKMRGKDIEFIHQSARDYLASKNGQSILGRHDQYGHGEITINCLSYLSRQLKTNLLHLARPDSTRETPGLAKEDGINGILTSLDYAATLWVQHLAIAKHTTIIQDALADHGTVNIFLRAKLLEWLECLSLIDKLPRAIEALKILTDIVDLQTNPLLSIFIQDATRFLSRHYQTLTAWPLQTYSSTIVFSPRSSIVRKHNLDKIPIWLRNIPQVEELWTSLIQTLGGHSGPVTAVAFSPDGKQIASGSWDRTIRLWEATTGELQRTLAGHSDRVTAVAFSPDGKQIASGSWDGTIKLWDVAKSLKASRLLGNTLGSRLKFRAGRNIKISESINCIKFSTDGQYLTTPLGYIRIKRIIGDGERADIELFKDLHVSQQWIYCGTAPVLRLPWDFETVCHDVRGNQLTIGFRDGRVLSFNIDCRRLQLELEASFR